MSTQFAGTRRNGDNLLKNPSNLRFFRYVNPHQLRYLETVIIICKSVAVENFTMSKFIIATVVAHRCTKCVEFGSWFVGEKMHIFQIPQFARKKSSSG